MKKVILNSPAFEGSVVVVYDHELKLILFDVQQAVLSHSQLDYFKKHVPILYTEQFLSAFGKGNKLSVLLEDQEINFEMWWEAYNVKRNKARCLSLWQTMSVQDRSKAYTRLFAYERFLKLNTWRGKAEPDTYLKKRYYDNEWK